MSRSVIFPFTFFFHCVAFGVKTLVATYIWVLSLNLFSRPFYIVWLGILSVRTIKQIWVKFRIVFYWFYGKVGFETYMKTQAIQNPSLIPIQKIQLRTTVVSETPQLWKKTYVGRALTISNRFGYYMTFPI